MSFSFDSVNDFIGKVKEARAKREKDREPIHEAIGDQIDDPRLIGVPPAVADQVYELVQDFGDEALRQIALFALGRWYAVHTSVVEDLLEKKHTLAALSATLDGGRISNAIELLEAVGSFGGDDDWRAMLKEKLTEAVDEALDRSGK